MDQGKIKALTFDTGGTVLDWHSGFASALRAVGQQHGLDRDWPLLANNLRRRSLNLVLSKGAADPTGYTFDHAHREGLDEVLSDAGLDDFTERQRGQIAYDAVHQFICWPDFPPALRRLRERYVCAPLTVLSFGIVVDTARHNGLHWDAIFACEAIGHYKPDPRVYQSGARFLGLDPSECLMVACHTFDLNAAKAEGFQTALVRRPNEWGGMASPELGELEQHDLIVDTFDELVQALL